MGLQIAKYETKKIKIIAQEESTTQNLLSKSLLQGYPKSQPTLYPQLFNPTTISSYN